MNDVQKAIFDVYLEIKRVCDLHNLTYYAIGGTCIGAVRHKGFIPWDDDIDLAMPVNDYLKFIGVAKNELRFPYSLYTPVNNPHWIRNFIKVHNVCTSFIEHDAEQYADRMTGVNVDIMPIFGMPKSFFSKIIMLMKNEYYHYMNRRVRLPYKGRKSVLNNIFKILTVLSCNGQHNDFNFFNNKAVEEFSKYSFDNSDKVLFGWRDVLSNRFLNFDYLLYADFADFKSAIALPFESDVMKVPCGYDHYLRSEFGEYMIIPPKEKQVTHRPWIVDLNCSYKNYLNLASEQK